MERRLLFSGDRGDLPHLAIYSGREASGFFCEFEIVCLIFIVCMLCSKFSIPISELLIHTNLLLRIADHIRITIRRYFHTTLFGIIYCLLCLFACLLQKSEIVFKIRQVECFSFFIILCDVLHLGENLRL